ncbi:MAG: membrane protein insertase YidC [Gemmatimonadota bacterium]|nr:membrane protein insertase YidC [Gemmatimonadota bacterium]
MEKRVLLAVVLSIGLIFLVNVLFPPVPRSVPDNGAATGGDSSTVVDARDGAAPPIDRDLPDIPAGEPMARIGAGAAPVIADTIVVRSELYEYSFSTVGAALVGAVLRKFEAYGDRDAEGSPVQLVRDGDRFLGYQIAVGGDTVRVEDREFSVSRRELVLSENSPGDSLVFTYEFPGSAARLVLAYHFRHDAYLVNVTGRLEGLEGRGYAIVTSLGSGLRTNEKNPKEDHGKFAVVTKGQENGVEVLKFGDLSDGEGLLVPGGPFQWVAVKSKYFLLAAVAPEGGPMFGGATVQDLPEEFAAVVRTMLPVPAGSGGFAFSVYMGPQDYGRLNLIGQQLQDVNSYGYRWLQPVSRPLVAIVMPILVWLHIRLSLAYGWVLILFGVLMRVVLFPLYQKSMRAQIGQMRVQPIVQEIRERHKDDPQKMQQEMMRVYKEEGVNPLAGCLPMLVPMPILFTLFFVFQGTIEFRGVPFFWLPDLSLKDPLYIIPVVMGASMFLLQWIGQRSMTVANSQMKMMMWAMPIFMTFLFANFPSGLNLYYTTSNLASLPQQLYLARERKAANLNQPKPATPAAPNKSKTRGTRKTGGRGG